MKKRLTAGGILLVAMGLAAGPAMASTSSGSNGTRTVSSVVSHALSAVVPVLTPLRSAPRSSLSNPGSADGHSSPQMPGAETPVAGASGSAASARDSSGYPSSAGAGSLAGEDNSTNGGYTPPLHGSNPHGEGSGLVVSNEPSPTPGTSNCDGPSSGEDLVIGRSCGQENSDGSYSGHVTILALGGQELLGENSTSSGTTTTGELAPLAGPVLSQLNNELSQLCSVSTQSLCLSLLSADSSSGPTGSTNSFDAASASVGGSQGLSTTALSSSGDISQSRTCQNASGSSSVADVAANGTSLASAGDSGDSSVACQNSSDDSQSASSHVLGGMVSAITSPLVGGSGCADGTPNTPVKPLGLTSLSTGVISIECNATDSDGSQAAAPYGTNDGLTTILLGSTGIGFGIQAPASESLARAPAAPPAPAVQPLKSKVGLTVAPRPPASPPAKAVAAEAAPAPVGARLPFTGLDLVLEVLVGCGLLAAGGLAWHVSRRRLA